MAVRKDEGESEEDKASGSRNRTWSKHFTVDPISLLSTVILDKNVVSADVQCRVAITALLCLISEPIGDNNGRLFATLTATKVHGRIYAHP